ncbi:phosphonate metabolism protein PhnP [Endozoicomonadaceae bacterium StTr2]
MSAVPDIEMTLTGTAAAGGVPLYGCDCPACLRAVRNPAYRRRATSAKVKTKSETLCIDCGLMNLAEHYPPGSLDAILLTHFHVDHVQGLFELRWGKGQKIPVYCPDDPSGCADLLKHSGILDFRPVQPFEPLILKSCTVTPLPLAHSRPCHGYLIEQGGYRIAYLTDTVGLPDETLLWLTQHTPDAMILDCSHPPSENTPQNHNDLSIATEIHQQLAIKRTILTHISHDMDNWLIAGGQLAEGIEVGHDGMTL